MLDQANSNHLEADVVLANRQKRQYASKSSQWLEDTRSKFKNPEVETRVSRFRFFNKSEAEMLVKYHMQDVVGNHAEWFQAQARTKVMTIMNIWKSGCINAMKVRTTSAISEGCGALADIVIGILQAAGPGELAAQDHQELQTA